MTTQWSASLQFLLYRRPVLYLAGQARRSAIAEIERASMGTMSRRSDRRQGVLGLTVMIAVVVTLAGLGLPSVAAAADTPLGVTPYSGFDPSLTRAPYVTDLTQTSAYVNWATTSG